jgi:hypothetical protein
MPEEKGTIITTFQLPKGLHRRLKMMCLLTETSMGEFIRVAIREKMDQLKGEKCAE